MMNAAGGVSRVRTLSAKQLEVERAKLVKSTAKAEKEAKKAVNEMLKILEKYKSILARKRDSY
jgi:aspartate-semialdehyde dehydrogenase